MGLEENRVKLDSLNKKHVAYCELLYGPYGSGKFDEKIKSCRVKVQEVDDYMDDASMKEDEGDVEEVDEEKDIESKKKILMGSSSLTSKILSSSPSPRTSTRSTLLSTRV